MTRIVKTTVAYLAAAVVGAIAALALLGWFGNNLVKDHRR